MTGSPEARAGAWARLAALAGAIGDDETRGQYLSSWRARFDASGPRPGPRAVEDEPIVPHGRLAGASEVEWRRLRLIGTAWWRRQLADPATGEDRVPATPDALGLLAWNAGRRVRGQLLDRESALRDVIELVGGVAGAVAAEVERSFEAGERRGYDAGEWLLRLRGSAYPQTDLGNAERFRDRWGDDFRFTTAKGWLGWDGRRWRVLDQEQDTTPAEVQAAVFATVRGIQNEARAIRDTGFADFGDVEWWAKHRGEAIEPASDGLERIVGSGSKAVLLSASLAKWGRGSESAGKLGCIAGLAKRWLTVPIEAFDTDPFALNVLNGTLRFRRDRQQGGGYDVRVDLEDHRREDLNTRLAPVEYRADADCPLYDRVLAWAQPDAAMRRYLHQWGGYSLSGHTGEQQLQFWYGKGANGKSTIIDAWANAAGDYAGTIGIETFLDQGIKKRGDAASPDLARLGGVRLLRASEPERGARLNESLIKAATGGEPMAVRALHKGFFDLRPLFKLTMAGNDRPDVPGTDEGIWRRLKLVPWEQFLTEDERDADLPAKLRVEGELRGILARLVAGLVDWMTVGFVEPRTVTAATAEFRDDSDPLARFLRLCTDDGDPVARTQSSHLFAVFAAWTKAAGETEWKQKGFSKAMAAKGFKRVASNGMHWIGLTLIKSVGDFIDIDGRVLTQDDAEATTTGERHPSAQAPPVPLSRPPPQFDDDFDDTLP